MDSTGTRLMFHAFADGFRRLSSGNFALVDADGNSMDIVGPDEMAEIVADDDDAVNEAYRSEAPLVAAGVL